MVSQREIERLQQNAPELYAMMVERGGVIPEKEQARLSDLPLEELFQYMMRRQTSEHLGIFDAHMSQPMRDLEGEILQSLNNNCSILSEVGRRQLRRELKAAGKSVLTELEMFCGQCYTRAPRGRDQIMSAGGIEYRVSSAEALQGPHFFSRPVMGYYGFLKYFAEEVALIAPPRANAYLLGPGWVVTVKDGRADSPIGSDSVLKPITRQFGHGDDLRHVVPVQFYQVEVDKLRAYKIAWTKIEGGFRGRVVEARA